MTNFKLKKIFKSYIFSKRQCSWQNYTSHSPYHPFFQISDILFKYKNIEDIVKFLILILCYTSERFENPRYRAPTEWVLGAFAKLRLLTSL